MTQAMCTSFKKELFTATHNFAASGGHVFKFALYTSSATLDAATTVYSTSNEVTGTAYVAGGFALTNVDPSISGTVAMVSFSANPTWSGATFSASQALIYNTSASNKAVAVVDFGGTQTVTSGTFVVTFPAVTSTTALLRLV
jgi:anaerobic selenocysteine-containing dehydrogenase